MIRKGVFQNITFSSAKKLACHGGELTLTSGTLLIDCKGSWSRSYSVRYIRLEAKDKILEIYDSLYGRLLFRLIVDDALEWVDAFEKAQNFLGKMKEYQESYRKRPEELCKLFELKPEKLKKILAELREERRHFGQKNIKFILTIQNLIDTTNNRKLKAFILAHCYVAWYEWTKNLLSMIYKGKFGKGPENDNELIKFLCDFPSLGALDTTDWGINANQIRNCVAHEKFYFDYKRSELVFTVKNKDKRIRILEFKWRFLSLSRTYTLLIQSLRQKVETGKIYYKDEF